MAMTGNMSFDLDTLDDVELSFIKNLIKNSKIEINLPKEFKQIATTKRKLSDVGTPKKRMQNEFAIVTGELMAGNDSHALKTRLRTLSMSMMNAGILTEKQVKDVISQFC